jgi:hypothetical protein
MNLFLILDRVMLQNINFYLTISNSVNLKRDISIIFNIINQKRQFSSINLHNSMKYKSSKFTGLIENCIDPEFVIIKGFAVLSEKQLVLYKNFIE